MNEQTSKEQFLQQQARTSGTLLERLEQSRRRIAAMCAERRGPRMTIPVEWRDDDFFICLALEDAIAALSATPGGAYRALERITWLHDRVDLLEAQTIAEEALESIATGPLKLDTDRQVFFYEQDHYYLSNFSAFCIHWRGKPFFTSEHAYHWSRFDLPEGRGVLLQDCLQRTASAHEAFRFAQDNKSKQRSDWDAVKVDTMRDILRAKVAQHEYVHRKLLETGDRELIENSWRDPYWGWGENRDGQNMLGKLWMEIRAELRERQS